MSILARDPATAPARMQQTRRTRRLLLTTAAALIAAGGTPSVSEVADQADVSRRTAYRYFPTQEQLLVEAALEGLRPVMESALAGAPFGDIEARVDALARNMQRLAVDHEALLRTMVRLTVSRPPNKHDAPRGGRRLEWIDDALQSLRPQLGRGGYARLKSAMAVCLGIEALIVLRDLCGLSAAQAEEISRWTARALLKQSLADARPQRRR